ncbi:MAG: hypothetical protein ACR2OB_03220 [Solirubrobacteraceae bacterium]
MSRRGAPTGSRLLRGELLSAASALVLLALMFGVEWYGIAGESRGSVLAGGRAGVEDAWHGLTALRWLMLLTIAVAIGSVPLHATQRSHGTQTDTSRAVTTLGVITTALLVYRVMIVLPTPARVVDQKLGALLGLLSAFGIALGGWESMPEQRMRARAVVHRESRT